MVNLKTWTADRSISVVSEPAFSKIATLASATTSRGQMGARLESQNQPASFRSINETATGAARRELRIYRPSGALSVIYLTTFGSDAKAIAEAEKIARYGYQVDVWRDGVRIDRVSALDILDRSEDQ
jgi:hypothetical protein